MEAGQMQLNSQLLQNTAIINPIIMNLKRKKICIVGDIFKNIADNKAVFTYSSISELIKNGEIKDVMLSLEQGVTEQKVYALKRLIIENNLEDTIELNSYFDSYSRCNSKLTHKHKDFNTMISDPLKKDADVYHSVLLLDERCAELSDHVTGKHIQGMVLIEAARQVVIAVLEKYFFTKLGARKVKLVMDSFDCSFSNYVFPFAINIRLKITESKSRDGVNGSHRCSVEFIQNGKVVAEIKRKVSVFDASFIGFKEGTGLDQFISDYISSPSAEVTNNTNMNVEGDYHGTAA
jgi:hypothetical protein